MGLIEKSIRTRANQKLAAPVFTYSTLSQQEVITSIEKICESLTAENLARLHETQEGGLWKSSSVAGLRDGHVTFYVEVERYRILVSFFGPPKNILAINPKARLKKNQAYWLAEVTFPTPPGDAPVDQLIIGLKLLRWVTDNNGKLRNREHYERFAAELHEAVSIDSGVAP